MPQFDQQGQRVDTQDNRVSYNYYNTPSGERIPLYHPPRASHFTDRKEALSQIINDLQPGRNITLHGPGGIGKTALAAEAVWRLTTENKPPERFPDGIVFHSFYNEPNSDLALEAIVRAFGEEPKPTPATAAQRTMAGRKALLFLDGTESADDFPKVLTVTGGCGLLVTTRNIMDTVDEWRGLHPLETDDALQLLSKWTGKKLVDDKTSKQICKLVGGLPLAIRLAGRYLNQTGDSTEEYLAWLKENPLEALDPDSGKHRLESVPWLLQRSLDQVSEPAREVLAMAGWLALAQFSADSVKEALQHSTSTLKRAFRQLTGYGLLLHAGERYEISHALIHTYARERLVLEDEAFSRMVNHYVNLANKLSKLEAEGYRLLDAERHHIMRLQENCVEREAWRETLVLMRATENYFRFQGHWTERRIAVERGLEASRSLEDHREEANCIQALGDVHQMLAEYKLARERYGQALPIYANISDRLGEANSIKSLGDVHLRIAEYELAREHYARALSIYTEIGDRLGEANSIKSLGDVHLRIAEYKLAREHYARALPIYTEIGDRLGEANCIRALSNVHQMLDEYKLAREHYARALPSYTEINDHLGEANCIKALGDIHIRLAEYEQARKRYQLAQRHYQLALPIYTEIGDRLGEANCIKALSDAHLRLNEYEMACKRYRLALSTYVEIGAHLGEANCIQALGDVHLRLAEYILAREHYGQALPIYAKIGDRLGEANCIQALGDVHQMLAEYILARERYGQALPIYGKIGDRLGEANSIKSLGDTHLKMHEYEAACKRYELALKTYDKIGARYSYATNLANLGLAHKGLNRVDEARKHLTEAIAIFGEIDVPNVIEKVRQWLDELNPDRPITPLQIGSFI